MNSIMLQSFNQGTEEQTLQSNPSQLHLKKPRIFGRDLTNQESGLLEQYKKLCRGKSIKEMKQQLRLNEQKENFQPEYQLENRNQKVSKTSRLQVNDKNEHLRFNSCDGQAEMLALNLKNKKIEEKVVIPTNVVEYVEEIFNYLRSTELKYVCNSGYMADQNDINPTMRAILFDWLVDVQIKFKLLPETLFLTFNIIDRYLEKVKVNRKKLQLVGVAALFIACKYEEIYPPQLGYYVQITEHAYSKHELLEMEAQIIQKLEFNFTITSSYRFLERYEQIAKLNNKESALCKYLIELSQIEYRMLKYQPSMLAASSIYLTNKLFKKQIPWENNLENEAKYQEIEIKQCAKDMCLILEQAGKNNLTAVKRKYASKNFLAISQIQIERVQK